jgi:hypothetical protein
MFTCACKLYSLNVKVKNKVAVAAFLLSVQIILYFELTLSKILKYYVF